MKEGERLTDRPRMMKEIAAAYGVDARTVRQWLTAKGLRALCSKKGRNAGYYYTIKELEQIVEAIGEP